MKKIVIAVCSAALVFALSACSSGGGGASGPTNTPDSNALLSGLTVSPGALVPVFSSATTTYTNAVSVSTAAMGVIATTGSGKAALEINGTVVVSGTTQTVALPVGTTDVVATVTAGDGVTSKAYTLSVKRPGVGLSPASADVASGHAVNLNAVLASPAVTDTIVMLQSSATSTVTVPSSVTVPAGQTQAAFSATSISAGPAAVTITATLNSDMATALVNVLSSSCGNGIVEAGEQCDDGNSAGGDGCSGVCQIESGWTCSGEPSACHTVCGDGIVAGAEQCDAGAANGTTLCGCQANCTYGSSSTTCAAVTCSGGVFTPASYCDGTGSCSAATPSSCPSGCTLYGCN